VTHQRRGFEHGVVIGETVTISSTSSCGSGICWLSLNVTFMVSRGMTGEMTSFGGLEI